MAHYRTPAIMLLSVLAPLLVASGCSTSAPMAAAYRREWIPAGVRTQAMRLVLTESELDVENLYPSTLLITITLDGGKSRLCSGVLIDSHLALTAAHCVCGIPKSSARTEQGKPRPSPPTSGKVIMDHLSCADSATVTAVVYKQQKVADSTREAHTGKVRPHHAFRIVLDPQGNVLENEADLAVIVLGEPFNSQEVTPVQLAKSATNLNDAVILAGFGPHRTNSRGEERRSGKSAVAAMEVSGRSFLVGEKGSHTLGGDSGGPCFHDGLLVGIATTSSTPPVAFSEFTSTYFHRDWLNEEIANARKTSSATSPGAP
jgi:Trypsin